MRYKITIYLLLMKIRFIILTLFLLTLFIQIINLIEVTRIVDSRKIDMITILNLSILKPIPPNVPSSLFLLISRKPKCNLDGEIISIVFFLNI